MKTPPLISDIDYRKESFGECDLERQYDRYLLQLREEIKELYWLYNFFFVFDSAILFSVLTDKISEETFVEVIGIFISLYWAFILRKQKLWRDWWLVKVRAVEDVLGYTKDGRFGMWMKEEERKGCDWIRNFFSGKEKLWMALYFLPVGFGLIFLVMFLINVC